MIKVVAKQFIRSGKGEELKNIVADLVAETRKEEGCISYQLFQDVNDDNVFTFIEEWQSQDALRSHMKAKHFVEAMPKLAGIQEKETEINVYTLVI